MDEPNTKGREDNAAQPLGEMKGTESRKQVKAVGEAERHSAGPDGPRAAQVSRTFKDGK